jgi:hypothetical protein
MINGIYPLDITYKPPGFFRVFPTVSWPDSRDLPTRLPQPDAAPGERHGGRGRAASSAAGAGGPRGPGQGCHGEVHGGWTKIIEDILLE